jgi:hypothetical protein
MSTLFATALPWTTRLRVIDLFFYDPKFSLRVALSILQLSRTTMLELKTRDSVIAYLNTLPSSGLTIERLLPVVAATKIKDDRIKKATKRAEALVRPAAKKGR